MVTAQQVPGADIEVRCALLGGRLRGRERVLRRAPAEQQLDQWIRPLRRRQLNLLLQLPCGGDRVPSRTNPREVKPEKENRFVRRRCGETSNILGGGGEITEHVMADTA